MVLKDLGYRAGITCGVKCSTFPLPGFASSRRRRIRHTKLQAVPHFTASPTTGYIYMALLALQFAFQPILTRSYVPTTIPRSAYVIAQELIRLLTTSMLLVGTGSWQASTAGWSLRNSLIICGLPTILYLVQNYCSLAAYQNLSPITYNVLNQTKTLSAAVCCYLLVGQRQSPLQMVALALLLLSALVMESIVPLPFTNRAKVDDEEEKAPEKENSRQYLIQGVIPILVASFTSGLAGAWIQKCLGTRSALLFSFELACLSLGILAIRKAVTPGESLINMIQSDGWTWKTWIPVITNATGGILVGLVTKYSGAVQKGFALIIGMCLSGLLQNATTGEKVSARQWVGGVIAGVSLWLHASYPAAR